LRVVETIWKFPSGAGEPHFKKGMKSGSSFIALGKFLAALETRTL
jgi:hypothetical protein